jgi:hypothetical protein
VVWYKSNENLRIIETDEQIKYDAVFERGDFGYMGFFIDFVFDALDNTTLVITTETNIIPEYFPFPDCTLEACFGTLI